jgi:iron complex transport system permease protein
VNPYRADIGAGVAARARRGQGVRGLSLLALAGLVVLATIWALTIGTTHMPAATVVDALLHYDGSRDHIVVVFTRLPRVLAGVLVGAALAVAGAIMQAATNNPLASPDLLGINSGAAFAVVMAITLLDTQSNGALVWFAFAGAAVAAVAVYAASAAGHGGATPLKLALAGAVLTAFLAALTTSVLVFDKGTLDQIRLWSAGSLAGRPLSTSLAIAPYIATGLAAAFLFRRQVMTLSLGADIARSVGQNAGLWRAIAAVMVVVLAGSAVALGGPIGFVGLIVPHVARMIVGVNYRWIIPFSALGGSLLLVTADAFARYALSNQALPVGVTMAVIGAPFFIYLARYRTGGMS